MNQEDNEELRSIFITEKKEDVFINVSDIDKRDVCFSDNYVFWLEEYVIQLKDILNDNI